MNKNGYNPSIMQTEPICYLCGRVDRKLDRHEVFGGAYRAKSKRLGLWCLLCHDTCHLNGVHAHGEIAYELRRQAQKKAMKHYGWTAERFIQEFGRNYLC